MAENSLLSVKVIDNESVIRIGVETLVYAVTHGPYFDQLVDPTDGKELKITDRDTFVKEIVTELLSESENGDTLVYRMLDKAAINAVENGAEGIELPSDLED